VSFEIDDGDLSSNLLSRDIDFSAVNDAPTLSGTEANAGSYIENDAPLTITGSTLVNDLDDTNIESASVVISNNFANGEDVLGFTSQSGITGTYDSTIGVLSLNGAANTSEDPSDLTRTVSFTINDGDENSNTTTRDIAFTAVNDAPVLSSIEALPTLFVENDAPAAGEDELIFTNQSGITGSFDSGTGVLTLTGSASMAEYQAAVRSVAYNNTSDNPSALTRTVSFEVDDGQHSRPEYRI